MISTKATTFKENLMEKVNITGLQVLLIMENSLRVFEKVRESGQMKEVIDMLDILVEIEKMVMENMCGPMETHIVVIFARI